METDKLLTVRETAERLGLREATVRKWIMTRRIAYVKLGRSVRVPKGVVADLIRRGLHDPIANGQRDFNYC